MFSFSRWSMRSMRAMRKLRKDIFEIDGDYELSYVDYENKRFYELTSSNENTIYDSDFNRIIDETGVKIDISDETKSAARARVNKLLSEHVLYPELDLDFLKKEFVK